MYDQWDIDRSDERLYINVDTGIIETKRDNKPYCYLNAFGSVIVKKGDVKTWHIKPLECSIPWLSVYVGIVESNKASKDMTGIFCNNAGIAYYGDDGCVRFQSEERYPVDRLGRWWFFPDAETIFMTLDMNVGKLMIRKGHNEIAINQWIDLNKEYCLAVSIPNQQFHKIQLLFHL